MKFCYEKKLCCSQVNDRNFAAAFTDFGAALTDSGAALTNFGAALTDFGHIWPKMCTSAQVCPFVTSYIPLVTWVTPFNQKYLGARLTIFGVALTDFWAALTNQIYLWGRIDHFWGRIDLGPG